MSAGVLLVDDDAAIRETLTQILEDEGYRVAVAANGKEALEHLASGAAPGAIILDLTMPVMDGRRFRHAQLADPALANIPVIVLTAERNAREKGEQLGTSAALQKPVRLVELLAVLSSVISSA
jgi:CheY-like chemotaxis protein